MQTTTFTLLLACLLQSLQGARFDARSAVGVQQQLRDDRPITKVVKLLEQMLEQSKADGEADREMFAKHKCYCDANTKEKTETIASLTDQIALLESKIEETKAETAILSEESAELTKNMAANKEQGDKASEMRLQENKEYNDFAEDMNTAIGQLDDAIKTLSEVGADQTFSTAEGHTQYMAGFDALTQMRSSVKAALLAANAFVNEKQVQKVKAFLQQKGPFTATYSSQAGEIMGILKDMRDTFKANLEEATKREEAAQAAHDKFMIALVQAYGEMEDSNNQKQTKLGTNDGDLSQAKEDLSLAEKEKGEAETFLSKLTTHCEETAKQYAERTQLRTQEEAAIAQAVAILNSDAAFESFGKTDATKSGATGMFLQIAQEKEPEVRQKAVSMLRSAAKGRSWSGVAKVLAMLQAENPFATVLKTIEDMLKVIEEEGLADQAKFDWCKDERKTKNDELENLFTTIGGIKGAIAKLDAAINDPAIGLKATIAQTEEDLKQNVRDQKDKTALRTEENMKYQKDIHNLVEAADLLQQAIKVLNAYYQGVLKMDTGFLQQQKKSASLLQASKEDPKPWELAGEAYEGQSADGVKAVKMVQFILDETKKEEQVAHETEDEAQRTYEGEMGELKDDEASFQDTLGKKQLELAEKEEELVGKEKDLKDSEELEAKTKAYLEKIKPGCDFIENNLQLRSDSRAAEKGALENAIQLIEETPAYKNFQAEAHNETLGDCLTICKSAPSEKHVDCLACRAGTSVPGYCAGHADADGC